MSKLSLDSFKKRVEAVASEDLLNAISGGGIDGPSPQNYCHCLPDKYYLPDFN